MRRNNLIWIFISVAVVGLLVLRPTKKPQTAEATSSAEKILMPKKGDGAISAVAVNEPTAASTMAVHAAFVETASIPARSPKIAILQEILASGSDNDPRMDRELKVLNSEEKQSLREMYHNFSSEERNHRGTVVFLLGRNLTGKEDFEFFQSVLREEPCLSLEDCRVQSEKPTEHISDVTLDYPQQMALASLARALKNKEFQNQFLDLTIETLRTGAQSHSESIAQKAKAFLKNLK